MLSIGQENARLIMDEIIQKIREAKEKYHRLVFIVGQQKSGKTELLNGLSRLLNIVPISINLELSRKLLEINEKKRSIYLDKLMYDLVYSTPGELALLDNTEILFDVSLKVEPFRLFQSLSRNKTIVVTWCGKLVDNYLVYAEPDHPEFKTVAITEESIYEMPIKKEIGS